MEIKDVNGVRIGPVGMAAWDASFAADLARRETEIRAQYLFGIYVRALRNCDWDGRIWQSLSEGEREAWRKVATE
jgi:hypothetical protein